MDIADAAPAAADPAEEAPATPEPAPAPVAEAAQADADAAKVKPSKALAGQDDLASRKGSWKFEAPSAPSAPAAETAQVADEAEEAPEVLTAARDGGADDLKLLKGVGPKLEQTLNELGFYHFDQVAAWTPAQVAWVDSRLKFKGRIERDGWIEQAKILAAGGETEFSKRNK